MSDDDDLIRRALRPPALTRVASSALRDIQPALKRRQRQRRALLGATGALVLSGSAALYAVANQPSTTSLRLAETPSIPTMAEPETTATTTSTTTSTTSTTTIVEVDDQALTSTTVVPDPPGAEAPAASASGTPARPPTPQTTTPNVAPTTPAPTLPAPTIAPPTTIADATSQALVSDCGSVTVTVQGATVRIVSITPNPGYTSNVGDDGPNSIEMKFTGPAGTCELHAEVKESGLAVAIQNPHSGG